MTVPRRIPPSDEVTGHARRRDGTCGDNACVACRLSPILEALDGEPAGTRLRLGKLLVEWGAAVTIEAMIELEGGGG